MLADVRPRKPSIDLEAASMELEAFDVSISDSEQYCWLLDLRVPFNLYLLDEPVLFQRIHHQRMLRSRVEILRENAALWGHRQIGQGLIISDVAY